MKRKLGGLLVTVFLAALSIAGVNAFLRDVSSDSKMATENLVLGVVCGLLTIVFAVKLLRPAPSSTAAAFTKKEPIKRAASVPQTRHVFEVKTERMDPELEVQTPKGAELSFLDAEALKYWNGKATDFKVPPYYTKTRFEQNVGPALGRLLTGGYLRLSDTKRNVALKTVPELKSILAAKGFKASGKKAELVQRILDNFSAQELRDLFPVGVYEITEKGQKALAAYSIIFANQEHGLGLSYFRLMKAKEKSPKEEDDSILARLLLDDIEKCCKTGDTAAYQYTLLKASDFFLATGDSERAFEYRILAFFMWSRTIESLDLVSPNVECSFIATRLEECAAERGLTFSQLTAQMYRTIGKVNPFGLGTKKNISYAVSILEKALSIK